VAAFDVLLSLGISTFVIMAACRYYLISIILKDFRAVGFLETVCFNRFTPKYWLKFVCLFVCFWRDSL
jgi:hypothetical protein